MTKFPKQAECDSFYGNPRGRGGAVVSQQWYKANMVYVKPPFKMAMGSIKITQIPIHKKCAEALLGALNDIYRNAGKDQRTIKLWGMDVFSGSFNYRPMRGLQHLSMHAYGCALDLDAPRNAQHDRTPHFAELKEQVVKPFLIHGATWGGDWNGNNSSADERSCDGMHFQWARMG